jgi:RecJ-like exonuclease
MIVLEGVVSRVRYFGHRREYTLTDGKGDYAFYSEESLLQGSCVGIEGEMGVEKIVATKVAVLTDERAAGVYERVKANIAAGAGIAGRPALVSDDVTLGLWPALKEAALELLAAKKLGRSVLLRFHGDADGICGAFALTAVIQCKAFQQNSAAYSVKDALRDIAAIGQENRPLVVLLDFGSGEGSTEGLGLLAAAGMDYMVLDHHPYAAKGNTRIINPFAIGENASKYTAGYLTCEVSVACGLDGAKALELARIACAGDKSDILKSGPEDVRKAMVLDFLASHVSFGNNLDFYKKVMEKGELFGSIAQQADESIREAAQKAMVRMKKIEAGGGLLVATFSLEGIVRKGEWPPSSKITTRVFDKMKAEERSGEGMERPLLCIGYTERSLIMRLNDSAVSLGLSANALAEKLKASMADFIEGGGGHVKAGAIRVKAGFVRDVLNELVREASSIAVIGNIQK